MTREDGGGVLELLERIGSIVVPIAVALYALLYIGIEQIYASSVSTRSRWASTRRCCSAV
ncbi:hypothetical protein [Nonomuraea dietziae]|uniref:hypothetical protein n=1 Tax=Nonomuraea dietziae TaxID=65515 RepID=UPI0031D0292B